jgi:hypothetical protein
MSETNTPLADTFSDLLPTDSANNETPDIPDLDFSDENIDDALAQRGEEKAPKLKQAQRIPHVSDFEIEGKAYRITEDQIRKYYGLDPADDISPKEWKTIVSNYKQGIQYNNKNREATFLKRNSEEVFRKLYENPKDTLKLLFQQDPARLKSTIEDMLLEELEDEMLPEADRNLKKTQKELEEYKRLIAEQEEQKQSAQMAALEDHYSNQIETQIIDVLENSPLPKNAKTVQRIAFYMHRGAQRGMDLKPSDVLPLVQEDIQDDINAIIKNASPEQLIQLLGEDKLKVIRKQDLQRVKGAMFDGRQQQTGRDDVSTAKQSTGRKTITPEEFREQSLRRLSKAFGT